MAGATAVGLWGVTAMVRPGVSRTYWLDVLTHPERTGDPAAVMDQSTNGLLHRVGWSSALVWAVLACVAIGVGLWRARRAHVAGDELAAISLVAIATLLASPVSWIHHAVWIVPATAVLLGDGTDRRRRAAWAITVAVFLSDAPMLARAGVPLPGPTAFLAENAFVFAFWALLLFLPISAASRGILARDGDRPARRRCRSGVGDRSLNDDPSGHVTAVICAGSIERVDVAGTANAETGAPLTASSVFYVGSLAKQFVAACAASLVADGALDTAAPVTPMSPTCRGGRTTSASVT